jgi:hypothetical protein
MGTPKIFFLPSRGKVIKNRRFNVLSTLIHETNGKSLNRHSVNNNIMIEIIIPYKKTGE